MLPELPEGQQVDAKQWFNDTAIVCRAYLRAELQQQALLPVLGRLLQIAKARPEIWNSKFASFRAFMTEGVPKKFGIEKSTAYEALQMATRFPDLSVKEFQSVGRQNMRTLLQAVPKGEEEEPYAKKLMAKAVGMKTDDFRDLCEKDRKLEPGETSGAFLRLPCNKSQLKFIQKFLANPEFQAICGTDNPAKMLVYAIEEATTEWRAQGEEAEKPKHTNGLAAKSNGVDHGGNTQVAEYEYVPEYVPEIQDEQPPEISEASGV